MSERVVNTPLTISLKRISYICFMNNSTTAWGKIVSLVGMSFIQTFRQKRVLTQLLWAYY